MLGERVREAVEILIRAHGEPLRALIEPPEIDDAEYRQFLADDAGVRLAEIPPDGDEPAAIAAPNPAEIYRAACRVAMRLVVILFAESRDLLPRDNALYYGSYGLNGLLEQLDRDEGSLADGFGAWPRVLALFRLLREGSHHPGLAGHRIRRRAVRGRRIRRGGRRLASARRVRARVFRQPGAFGPRCPRRVAAPHPDDGSHPSGPCRRSGGGPRRLLRPFLGISGHSLRGIAGLRTEDGPAPRSGDLPLRGRPACVAAVAPGSDGRRRPQGAARELQEERAQPNRTTCQKKTRKKTNRYSNPRRRTRRRKTPAPSPTSGETTARGRKRGHAVRRRWRDWSGDDAAGRRPNADSRTNTSLRRPPAGWSPAWSSPASGTWCAGAARARVPAASTPAPALPYLPYIAPSVRWPTTRRAVLTDNRIPPRRRQAGRRSYPKKSLM